MVTVLYFSCIHTIWNITRDIKTSRRYGKRVQNFQFIQISLVSCGRTYNEIRGDIKCSDGLVVLLFSFFFLKKKTFRLVIRACLVR